MKFENSHLFDYDDISLSNHRLTVSGETFNLNHVTGVRSETLAKYGGKAIPFGLTVLFTVWAAAEIVNAPDETWLVGVAVGLALFSALAVWLVGQFQTHSMILEYPRHEVVALVARDPALIAKLTQAVQRDIASRASGSGSWSGLVGPT